MMDAVYNLCAAIESLPDLWYEEPAELDNEPKKRIRCQKSPPNIQRLPLDFGSEGSGQRTSTCVCFFCLCVNMFFIILRAVVLFGGKKKAALRAMFHFMCFVY